MLPTGNNVVTRLRVMSVPKDNCRMAPLLACTNPYQPTPSMTRTTQRGKLMPVTLTAEMTGALLDSEVPKSSLAILPLMQDISPYQWLQILANAISPSEPATGTGMKVYAGTLLIELPKLATTSRLSP